ncbi:MAG: methyltransferase domain-containing protein [Armatimonadota bacterium]|jgi:SAM-dependent methyltransferase
MLSEKLIECLICPACGGGPLNLAIEESDGEVIVSANLGCPDCKRWYPVRDDIPRMMPPDLGTNLSAADERWRGWGEAMERFVHWRDEAWRDPAEAAARRERAREMHARFIEFCGLPARPLDLLDVGSGTGHVAELLPDSARYIGIDPLPGGCAPGGDIPPEMPRPRRPVGLVQGVGELLPFAGGSFDVVLMMGSIDHARSPAEVLSEGARVLRPGGLLGVLQSISASEAAQGPGILRSIIDVLTGREAPTAGETHLHAFPSVEAVAEAVSAEFEVNEVTEYSGRAFVRAVRREGGA